MLRRSSSPAGLVLLDERLTKSGATELPTLLIVVTELRTLRAELPVEISTFPLPQPLARLVTRMPPNAASSTASDQLRASQHHRGERSSCRQQPGVGTGFGIYAAAEPVVQTLLRIPGIGILAATALFATVGNIHTFKSGRQLTAGSGCRRPSHPQVADAASAASVSREIPTCACC
jgi:hypothetical protein